MVISDNYSAVKSENINSASSWLLRPVIMTVFFSYVLHVFPVIWGKNTVDCL